MTAPAVGRAALRGLRVFARGAVFLAALWALRFLAARAGVHSMTGAEAVWVLVGVWFVSLAARLLWAAARTFRDVRARRLNGGRRIVTRNSLRREVLRAVRSLCLCGAGVVLALRPQPAARPAGADWAALLLIVDMLLDVADAYYERREGTRLLGRIAALETAKRATPPPYAPHAEPGGVET